MFVQMIRGNASAEDIRAASDRWVTGLKPGAIGFLGSTAGATADGAAVLVARFEDRAAAEANSARPEQGEWWSETEKIFDGEPTFHNSEDVDVQFGGGSDDAGFVQVMDGRVADRSRLAEFEAEWDDRLRAARPDLLGSLRIWLDDERCTVVAYFTSEADARAGESSADGELAEAMEAYRQVMDVDRFLDLPDPAVS